MVPQHIGQITNVLEIKLLLKLGVRRNFTLTIYSGSNPRKIWTVDKLTGKRKHNDPHCDISPDCLLHCSVILVRLQVLMSLLSLGSISYVKILIVTLALNLNASESSVTDSLKALAR